MQEAGKSCSEASTTIIGLVKLEIRRRVLFQPVQAESLNVSPSYVNKVENERLHFGDYPSAKFIHKLADELEADEDELLLLADKVPARLRKRIREKPEAFRQFAALDNRTMDRVLGAVTSNRKRRKR